MDRLTEPGLPGTPTPAETPLHLLDHPIWNALTTHHRRFAQGGDLARRYPAQVAPFVAARGPGPAGVEALAQLLTDDEPVVMIQAEAPVLPGSSNLISTRFLEQMVGPARPGSSPHAELVRLRAEDAPAMMALVALAKPGPFAVRTHELGTYLGVRDGHQLVAMAGERMRLDGFTEISAVCTHPEHRGRGHARALIAALMEAIAARGERPFLHVLAENRSAIALYLDLGFTFRKAMHLTVFRRG